MRHALINHTYPFAWSQIKNGWVVVAENIRGRGKSILRRKLIAAAMVLISPMALAAPIGGQVSAGSGAITQSGATTTINQQSQSLAINWQSFGIAANEAVRFNQLGASSIALNRVLGQDPSQILGNLSANGQVFILNPNGVLFGSSAQINVGGLVASTLSISDTDFMAGKYGFSKSGAAGSVVNQGVLAAANTGYIALLAPEVRNEGVITATLGTALLAAGDKVTLNLNNGSLLSYSVDQGSLNALAENRQLIQADGGQVIMSAKAADALSTSVVNNTGVIEARTIENHNGVIKLLGDMQAGQVNVGGTLDASAPNGGDGGLIETSAAHVKVANIARITTVAPAGNSGTWLIDPYDFTIAATGGDITGAALATALGVGAVTIQTAAGSVTCTGATCGTGNAAGNGDIFVNDAVSWSANKLTLSAYRNININANLNGSGTASLALAYGQGALAAGNLSDYIIHAAVNLPAGSNFTTKLGSNGAVKNYTVITSLGAAGSITGADLQGMGGNSTNLAKNYVLGSNINAIATSTWNSNAGFNPVGNSSVTFSGTFDGLGHTISNLVINRPATSYVGLFGMTVSTGNVVRNVGLVGGSVSGLDYVGMLMGNSNSTISNSYATGSVNGQNYVGGLVGNINKKTVSTSYTTGGVLATGDWVGGLAGNNGFGCTINNSYATGSVTSNAAGGVVGIAGGLVGLNSGTIKNSYSTGSVSSNATAGVGGLVGYNYALVSNSFWDTGTSGKSVGIGGTTNLAGATGMTAAQMMAQATYPQAAGQWDFTNTWYMIEGSTRPFLRMEYSTTITNTHQLQLMAMNLGANYTLANNIAMSELAQASSIWNTTNGFVPVGSSGSPFTGTFNGQNYAISSLLVYLPNPGSNYVGLFGSVSGASLSNVSVAGNVTGYDYVGALVGKTNNLSTITNVTSTASVTGHSFVGGVVGANDPSTINNVSASGTVIGATNVGGVVGWNLDSNINGATFSGTVTGLAGSDSVGGLVGKNSGASNISNVFASGSVSGSTNTGGVIGLNDSATISNGAWVADTVGPASAIGGGSATTIAGLVGLTLAQTHQQASYVGWDFTSTWRIYEGHTVPLLKSLLKPLTITANNVTKVYDGTSVSLTGVVYSDPTAAGSSNLFGVATPYGVVTKNNVGTYAADIWSNQYGYDITIVGGALTVSKAALSIGGITAANKVYDASTAATVSTAGAIYTGLLGSDAVTVSATGTFADKNVANGKTVTLTSGYTGADAGNYTITDQASATANITPAALSITANADSKIYDGLAYSGGNGVAYSGLVNGETSAILGGALAYGGSSQGAINTGSYAITPSGLTSGNYTISYIDGVLTVNPAPAPASALPAGGATTPAGQAVVALGGVNLLTAFNGAMVVAMAPVNSVVVPATMPSNSPPAATPKSSDQPGSKSAADNNDETPAQHHNVDVAINGHDTITHVGALTLVNGGVRLPLDMKKPEEGNIRSGNKNSDRKNRTNGSDERSE